MKNPIKEKALEMYNRALVIHESNPDISSIWFKIEECEIEHMRELQNRNYELNFDKHRGVAFMQVQHLLPNYGITGGICVTIFVHSKKLEFKNHTVTEFAYTNV